MPPSSSPAPAGIDASMVDAKPCNRSEKQEGEVVGITKQGYLVPPPDEGADPKARNHLLSWFLNYLFGRVNLVAEMITGAAYAKRCFILDSGARDHRTSIIELLVDNFIQGSSATVLDACDGRHPPIEGVGSSLACHGFCIPNVQYDTGLAPGYTLVSVQQLAGSGYLVFFGGGRCYVKNRKDGSLVGKGRLHQDDGSYHLDFLQIPPDEHQGSN